MYTANIADTVMFRNLGKHPSPHLQKLKSAVEDAGTEIWVPAAVYHELADTGECRLADESVPRYGYRRRVASGSSITAR